MYVIGLIGGIASGKSAVAKELAAVGAKVLDADAAAHKLVNRPDVRSNLVDRWGNEILDSSGNIDRTAVARRVFSTSDTNQVELEFLESQLHPIIREDFEAEIARLSQTDIPAVVIDAPLLLEAGWGELCDVILLVESPRVERLSRAKNLRNWSPEEFAAREASQMSIEEKRKQATHSVANDGTLETLLRRVRQFWQILTLTNAGD